MRLSLSHRISKDCCMFGDVDIYECGARAAYDCIMEEDSYVGKLACANSLPAKAHCWCLQHEQWCPLRTGSVLRVGGFPCQDFSRAGKQLGCAGPRLPVILGYGRKAQETQNDLLCIENVESCPRELVTDAFGGSYTWCVEQVFSPCDVGFSCVSRPRPLNANIVRRTSLKVRASGKRDCQL